MTTTCKGELYIQRYTKICLVCRFLPLLLGSTPRLPPGVEGTSVLLWPPLVVPLSDLGTQLGALVELDECC